MALIGFASTKGSPGVSTTALGVALLWPSAALTLLVEADLAGSSVVPGWFRARQSMDSALMSYAMQRSRLSAPDLSGTLTPLTDQPSPALLQGFTSPAQSASMKPYWGDFGSEVSTLVGDGDAIIDLGRLQLPEDPRVALLRHLDHLVVVSGTSLPEVASLRESAAYLRPWLEDADGALSQVSLVTVGSSRAFSPEQIATACNISLLASLPFDPVHAEVLSMGSERGRRFDSSAYARGLHQVIEAIGQRAQARARQLQGHQ